MKKETKRRRAAKLHIWIETSIDDMLNALCGASGRSKTEQVENAIAAFHQAVMVAKERSDEVRD